MIFTTRSRVITAGITLLLAAGCGGNDGGTPAPPADAAATSDQGRGTGGSGAGGAAGAGGATGTGGAASTGGAMGSDAGALTDLAPAVDTGNSVEGGSADPATLARYIGVWTYRSGGEKLVCPGRPDRTADATGNTLTMKAGTGGAALEMASPTCGVRFAVSGDVASALAGQACMSASGGATLNYALDAFTFTLKDATATEASSWTITFTDTAGTLRCTLTTSGTLDRR